MQVAFSRRGILCLLASPLWTNGAQQQKTDEIPRPALSIGDSWTYTRIEQFRDKREFTRTLSAIVDDHYVFQDEPGGVELVTDLDGDWKTMSGPGLKAEFSPSYQRLRFPLQPGMRWHQSFQIMGLNDSGDGGVFDVDIRAAVGEHTTIDVAAGKFNALPIRIGGWWHLNTRSQQQLSGSWQDDVYYSSTVLGTVKSSFTRRGRHLYGNDPKTYTSYADELTLYKVANASKNA